MAGGTIMVVDDDQKVLRSLERILIADGYDVICRASAAHALQSIAADPPDAIILDLLMPAMNGRQFLEKLRDGLGFTDIPVVMITGVRGIDVNQAISMGASDVIEKPFDPDHLLNKIALAMFRSHQVKSATKDSPAPAIPKATRRTGEFSSLIMLQETLLLVADDNALVDRLEGLLMSNIRRLVNLVRVTDELSRVVRAINPKFIFVDICVAGAGGGMGAVRKIRESRDMDATPMLLVLRESDDLDAIREQIAPWSAACLPRPFDDQDILSFLDHPPSDARRRNS